MSKDHKAGKNGGTEASSLCCYFPTMADKPAAPATANAVKSAESAPGSASTSTPTASHSRPELSIDTSAEFDVESLFMAEPEAAQVDTTNEEGAEHDETAPAAEDTSEVEAAEAEDDPEEPAIEADPEAESDAEVLKALKPKAIKRFNQMLSQRDEALREAREAKQLADTLKAQIEQRENAPPAIAKPSDPLAKVVNEEQLEAHETFYRTARSWLRSHPNGGVPPVELTGGQEVEFDAETVGAYLDRYETLLESVPKRREFLKGFQAERAKAREVIPEMFQASTPENKAAQDYRRKLLTFDSQADQDLIIAKLLKVDRMEREEREGGVRYTKVAVKPAAAPAPVAGKPQPKPATPAARTPVVRAAGAKAPTEAAWERVNAPGGQVDVEELMDA